MLRSIYSNGLKRKLGIVKYMRKTKRYNCVENVVKIGCINNIAFVHRKALMMLTYESRNM
jgi:hypothetical protein